MPRILIIEDERNLLESISLVFEMEGYEVTSITTGDYGLDEALRRPPDLIILDIKLYEMSGIEITRELRRTPQTTAIPIIMITAHVEPELYEAGIEAGANLFLRKPFKINELLTSVRQFLER